MPNGQSSNQHPTSPRSSRYGVQRDRRAEVARVFLLAASLISLSAALVGIVKLIFEIFTHGFYELPNLPTQLIIVAIAFAIGWVLAFIGVRRYNNLFLPILIDVFAWGVVLATCLLYGRIMQKLFSHGYTLEKYGLYWLLLLIGFSILVALELIPDNHKLILFSFPVFITCLVHLVAIVIHYVFAIETITSLDYVFADILMFFGMTGMGLLLLFDMPFLKPIRKFFDKSRDDAQIQLIEDRR